MPALAILTGDGGSWHTRHLKLRAAFARQAVAAAEWAIQHVPGESMVADIGTKPLTAARLNFRKNLMGKGKFCDPNENEVELEEKEKGEKVKEKEKKDDRLVSKELKRLAQTAQVLQLITSAATLSVSKAEEGEKAGADGSFSFEIIVIYTLLVIFLTLVAQRLLDVAVRGAEFVIRQCVFRAQPGSHAEDAGEGNGPSRRDRLEPLVEESSTATGGEDPEHVAPQPAQQDAPRLNRNVPQPDPEPESPRPTISQSTGLTNALAALRVHEASMPDYEAEWREIEQEEWLVREELTQALPGDPLLGPLQPQTLRRRDPTPALPELSFKVITTRYGTVNHTRYNSLFSNCANNWTDGVWMVQSVPWWISPDWKNSWAWRYDTFGGTTYSYAHTDVTCSRAEGARRFSICTSCLDGTQGSLSWNL